MGKDKAGGQGIGLVLARAILLAHSLAFRLEATSIGHTAFTAGLAAAPAGETGAA